MSLNWISVEDRHGWGRPCAVTASGERFPLAVLVAGLADGKTYPYTGTPEYDAIVLKRTDAHTTEGSNRKGGKEVQTTRTVMSADGKTRTLTANGTNLKGQKVHNVLVFEKQ